MNRRARTVPTGRRSHRRRERPSSGSAARNVAALAATRRRLVMESAMSRADEIDRASQPTRTVIVAPSRSFRSSVPSTSATSMTSVFTSATSTEPVAACQASRSTTPRSPYSENETSGLTIQPGRAAIQPSTCSARAACRSFSTRSTSRARARAKSSTRRSRTPATRRTVATVVSPTCPRSILETTGLEVSARAARSCWRRPRLIRASLTSRPNARSSKSRRCSPNALRGRLSAMPIACDNANRGSVWQRGDGPPVDNQSEPRGQAAGGVGQAQQGGGRGSRERA